MPALWPTSTDLQNLLTDAGIYSAAPSGGLTAYVPAAVDEFERRTGRSPFLGTAQTRYYDPPGPNQRRYTSAMFHTRGGGRVLDLGTGLITLTTVTVGYTPSSPGTIYTENVEFVLQPEDAVNEERPFERIEFTSPQWGPLRSIKVVGTFGWQATVPDDAWLAVLHKAGALAAATLIGKRTGGVSSVKLGMNSFEFGASPWASTVTGWQAGWDTAVARYRRLDV